MILPIAHYPQQLTDAQRAAIRAAKADIDTDIQCILTPAVPGGPTRVLSLAGRPPFVCDAAIVTPGGNLKAALEWILFDGPIERGYTVRNYVADLLGGVETTTGADQFAYDEELVRARENGVRFR